MNALPIPMAITTGGSMTAATAPRSVHRQQLLRIDRRTGAWSDHRFADLPSLLGPGDLLVLNDAGTLPASLFAVLHGQPVELRLAGPIDTGWVALLGPGSWRLPTEHRLAPPIARRGDRLTVHGVDLTIEEISPISPRLVRIALPAELVWRHGRPVQYSYLQRDLHLADVQTPYAGAPWAVEMPSAGRPMTLAMHDRLTAAGIGIARLTHAAGLSATGDPQLDAALPLPERYHVPDATWRAVGRAERVIAVGTSVVRALESAARGPRSGETSLTLGAGTPLLVTDGLLSGMHEPGESHFALMSAFARPDHLRAAVEHADRQGYVHHEFGDSTLLL